MRLHVCWHEPSGVSNSIRPVVQIDSTCVCVPTFQEEYMSLLVGAFNPGAAEGIMCRETVSVGWDGRLYDCDFNQQLVGSAAGVECGRSCI